MASTTLTRAVLGLPVQLGIDHIDVSVNSRRQAARRITTGRPTERAPRSRSATFQMSADRTCRERNSTVAGCARIPRRIALQPRGRPRRQPLDGDRTEPLFSMATIAASGSVEIHQPRREPRPVRPGAARGLASGIHVPHVIRKTTGGTGPYGRGSRQVDESDVPDAAIVAMEKSGSVPIAHPVAGAARRPRAGAQCDRGMRAQPGDVLFRVRTRPCLGPLIDVAERDLGALSVGQPVVIRARGLAGREFTGTSM